MFVEEVAGFGLLGVGTHGASAGNSNKPDVGSSCDFIICFTVML